MIASRRALRDRWRHEEDRIAAIVLDLQNGNDWTRNLLASENWRELPGIHECGRKAWKTEAAPRDLRGVILRDIDLSGVEGLSDTALDYGRFQNVPLDFASLNGSSLRYATFHAGTMNGVQARFSTLEHATCSGLTLANATIRNANLSHCDFRNADLRQTSFIDVDLSGCNFQHADLRGVLFRRVRITEEGVFGFLSFVRRWTKFGGHRQTMHDLNETTGAQLRAHIDRSSQILELWQARPIRSFAHYLFSNFGLSATRFGMSTLGGVWLIFAALYAALPLKFTVGGTVRCLSIWDAMYFSVVTITTLGYGDIAPSATSGLARFLVGAEAITGIVILGVFIDRLVRDRPKHWE